MDGRIAECLADRPSKEYILPFFWQHGEAHEILSQEIEAIQNCGINEFCVESRIHEQFGKEKWWEDFGFILKEAQKRGMRVWLLDDKCFPTGLANQYLEKHPEWRMVSLRVKYADYAGPQTEMALLPGTLAEGENWEAIIAYRRKENGSRLTGEGLDLLPMLDRGLLWWDIPEGIWRVYYIIRTHNVCSPAKRNYIDMMSPESCRAMLHAVYEPHYEHFKEYFGNTFAGFFSDEPSFSNDVNTYDSVLGKEDMLIPWSSDVPERIAEKTGVTKETVRKLLPGLWHEIEGRTSLIREGYMETATEKYRSNFSNMLGDWCRAHHVMYIGHIIEDMNAHQRLGYGPGHYFRALDGQDMAGIDVVLNQMIPGQHVLDHAAPVAGKIVDPKFFHYTLAKLASSHSHIQPLKKNRAMCELFGAFGWAEGLPMMKYLVDHMLVCGINYFVPHAFSPKYPDADCPPHFYARGTNSQYPLFRELMLYTERMAHALSGDVHVADVAVYYNAEAEWSGGKYMLQQEVCCELTRNQIDFDLIPQDVLAASECREGKLVVNEESYGALVVPYSQYLPKRVTDAISRLLEEGLSVLFVDQLPDRTSELLPVGKTLERAEIVPLKELAGYLSAHGHQSVRTDSPGNDLRFYHTKRENGHLFLFWNEDLWAETDIWATLPVKGKTVFYDGWKNRLFRPQEKDGAVRLKLCPGASILVYVETLNRKRQEGEGPDPERADSGWETGNIAAYDYADYEWEALSLDWNISIKKAEEKSFAPYRKGKTGNLAKEMPEFAGVIRYETQLCLLKDERFRMIDLGRVGETAQLWVNGIYCGAEVSAPFRFDVEGKLKEGENKIRVEVMSNLGYRERDGLSQYLPLPPTGLIGPVKRNRRKGEREGQWAETGL